MKAALDLLQEAEGRKVAVLGDMFELGKEEESMHRETGAYAARGKADLLFCVGSLSKAMYEGALAASCGEMKVFYLEEKEGLYPLLEEQLLPGDTILLKASHSMGFSQVADWLKKR